MGFGAMTGRAAGFCAGYNAPGFANGGAGRGFGGGRGWRNRFYATGLTGWQRAGAPYAGAPFYAPTPAPAPTREQQLEALKGHAGQMAEALEGIRKRIDELEAQTRES